MHKKSTLPLTPFLSYCKDVAMLLFWQAWPCPPRLMASTSRIVSCFSARKKSTSFLPFLRYCKDITNLSFWVLWTCLAMTSKNNTTSLEKTLMFIFMQNIFIPHLFEILQGYCKLVILDILCKLGHAHQNNSTNL